MKKIKKITFVVALCFSQFFIQCSNDDNNRISEKVMKEQETNEIALLRNFLSTSLPMNINKIIYDSNTSTFIIDGDVVMPLEHARDHYSHSGLKNTNKINQQSSVYKLQPEMAALVQVYISSEVTSEWRIAMNKAINTWNNTNSSINITTVNTSTSLSVNLIMGDIGDRSIIANAYYPSGGKPGTRIMINTNFANKLNDADRIHTMIHELGHTFGLSHTNESSGSLIPCTSSKDTSSIMGMHDDTTTFTYYDNVAISTLFPVAVGAKKLYRFKKNQYYFYTTDPCEIVDGKDGYVFDKDAGYLYEAQIAGTVPLYRILNGNTVKDHRLNKVQTSSNDVILGYLYPTQEVGTVPLYNYGIYEARPGETPSYVYHILHTTDNSDAILKVVTGYVVSK